MHGALDKAISTVGKATAAIRKKWLGLALRESGTFLQPEVADPDRPGELLPVAGLSFHLAASAAPLSDPVTGTPVAPPTPDTLKRGDPLLPGQYAVHDVDALVTPYLPDPVATGVSLVFPEADPVLRQAETAAGHLGVQSLTLRYPGSWPLHEAYRLVVQHGEQLDGVVEGNRLTISVPPGEQLRVRLSSAMDRASLRVFGLWRTLHAKIRDVPQLEEAAADGWLWWLTPAAEMTLVHAVPRPVEAPSFALLRVSRSPDETTARLLAAVKVHAPSTDRLDLEASWVEQHDDLAKPGPETVTVADVACHTSVGYDESLLILFGERPPKPLHAGFHHFGDTRHRTVDYTLRATTRYREFFPTEVANDKDALSRISVPTRVVVPSTKRPVKTVVRDVLPLFRWSDETQVAQPFGVRRTRRAGLRLYLDRPWHTTGDGELLGVVLGEHATRSASGEPVSQWASDPVWGGQEGPDNANDLPLLNVASLLGGDPAGQPVRGPDDVLGEDGAVRKVLGYRPEYNSDRRLWFVDIALTPGPAFWPFVRLAVARYQPSSLPGLALGPVVQCDYAQLAPERSLVVARTDDGQVKVAVSGAIGNPRAWKPPPVSSAGVEDLAASRTMHVRLERRVPEIGTDLGWQVLSTDVLPVLSTVESIVTWEGTVTLARPHGEPARPGRGGTGDLRIVVEEVERLEADPSGDGALRTSSRVVYADEVVL